MQWTNYFYTSTSYLEMIKVFYLFCYLPRILLVDM